MNNNDELFLLNITNKGKHLVVDSFLTRTKPPQVSYFSSSLFLTCNRREQGLKALLPPQNFQRYWDGGAVQRLPFRRATVRIPLETQREQYSI
mmetsp:Transcript_7442/g.13738  ORF Transcript_7442/g.13738 Transcript_7442/m.13738 type:complete len:93 (-) Transcript_7442:556-834(-)